MDDPELKAMAGVVAAVDGLDEEVIVRVIIWAAQRFKVLLSSASQEAAGRCWSC